MRALLPLILLLLTGQAWSLTLQQAKELAERNYPKVKALKEEIEEEKLKREVSKRKRLGEVDLIAGCETFNRNYMLTPLSHLPTPLNPPPFDSKKATYGLSLSVPLYLGGALGREVKVSRVRQELLKHSLKATKWQLKLNAATLFLEALAVKEEIEANRQYLESLKTLLKNTRAGVEAGKLPPVDLLKISYSLKEAQVNLRKLKENYKALIVALETFTGREVKRLEKPKFIYGPKRWNLKELYLKSLKRSSVVKEAQNGVELAQAEKELIKAKYRPKVILRGLITRNYGFDSGKNEAYGQLSVNLTFPLFTGGREKLELLQKERKRLRNIYKEEEVKRQLMREIAKVVALLNSTQEEIEAEREGLKLAKEVERIEEIKYESGKGDINHLLLAKANRFKSQARLNSAYYRWLEGIERLKALLEVEDEQ